MGCRLSNFKVGKWEHITIQGHDVEYAPATSGELAGVVYKLDGVFQGFTGSVDAVTYHVKRSLHEGSTTKMSTENVTYVVLNENTLGYINNESPNTMGVLAGSIIRGGHSWENGPVTIVPTVDKMRPATPADFDNYRVEIPPVQCK